MRNETYAVRRKIFHYGRSSSDEDRMASVEEENATMGNGITP